MQKGMKIEQLGYDVYALLSPIYSNVDIYAMPYWSLKFAFVHNG
jgi:hypothetical protein